MQLNSNIRIMESPLQVTYIASCVVLDQHGKLFIKRRHCGVRVRGVLTYTDGFPGRDARMMYSQICGREIRSDTRTERLSYCRSGQAHAHLSGYRKSTSSAHIRGYRGMEGDVGPLVGTHIPQQRRKHKIIKIVSVIMDLNPCLLKIYFPSSTVLDALPKPKYLLHPGTRENLATASQKPPQPNNSPRI